jgi:hypothetical protein
MQEGSGFDLLPLYYYDAVLDSCAQRLGDSPTVVVETMSRNTSRGDGIKRAREETEAYVVLLEIRGGARNADVSTDRLNDMSVEYWVLAPGTAKVIASGNAYLGSNRKGGVVVGPAHPDRTNAQYLEYLLREAGRAAAERILSALHKIPSRGTTPGTRP